MAFWLGAVAALLTVTLLIGWILLIGYMTRRRLRDWIERTVAELIGPPVVRLLPPRTVLYAVLEPLFGKRAVHDDLLFAVLGGAGLELDGRDTVASRVADMHFKLSSMDGVTCRAEATWTYEFSRAQGDHQLVIFGTHDRRMATAVTHGRVHPLYELWILNSEDELEEFARLLEETVAIGITYRDAKHESHVVTPRACSGEQVLLRDYPKLVSLPDDLRPDDLLIVRYDLHDLVDPDHDVDSVESVTLQAANDAENLGFFTWTAPYPCFVREIGFDLAELARDGETLAYRVVPSAAAWYKLDVERRWLVGIETLRFELNSWMLTGHGVTLVWRSLDGVERKRGLPER